MGNSLFQKLRIHRIFKIMTSVLKHHNNDKQLLVMSFILNFDLIELSRSEHNRMLLTVRAKLRMFLVLDLNCDYFSSLY